MERQHSKVNNWEQREGASKTKGVKQPRKCRSKFTSPGARTDLDPGFSGPWPLQDKDVSESSTFSAKYWA